MAELLQSFEAGATVGNGNAVTAANSDDAGEAAVSGILLNGGTINYTNDSTKVMHGAWAAEYTQATPANTTYLELLDGAGGQSLFTTQFGLFFTGLPDANIAWPVQPRSTTNAQLGSLQITTAGQVRVLRPSGATVVTGTTVLSANTKYVVNYYGQGGSTTLGEVHVRVYDWATGSQVESVDATAFDMTTGLIDRFRWGKAGAATLSSFVLDGIKQNLGSATPYTYTPAGVTQWVYGYDARIGG